MYWKQDVSRESPNGSIQSPEITSKLSFTDDEAKDNVKRLTEKLSAALVNVSAKEDLVKQHARVAEEAVAGKHFASLVAFVSVVFSICCSRVFFNDFFFAYGRVGEGRK